MARLSLVATLLVALCVGAAYSWNNANVIPRRINCIVSKWGDWGVCRYNRKFPQYAACKVRGRSVMRKPRNGGASCPVLYKVQACVPARPRNVQPTPRRNPTPPRRRPTPPRRSSPRSPISPRRVPKTDTSSSSSSGKKTKGSNSGKNRGSSGGKKRRGSSSGKKRRGSSSGKKRKGSSSGKKRGSNSGKKRRGSNSGSNKRHGGGSSS